MMVRLMKRIMTTDHDLNDGSVKEKDNDGGWATAVYKHHRKK
jgi:hypothetical protein